MYVLDVTFLVLFPLGLFKCWLTFTAVGILTSLFKDWPGVPPWAVCLKIQHLGLSPGIIVSFFSLAIDTLKQETLDSCQVSPNICMSQKRSPPQNLLNELWCQPLSISGWHTETDFLKRQDRGMWLSAEPKQIKLKIVLLLKWTGNQVYWES